MIPRPWHTPDCLRPRWQPTGADPDGFPEDFCCPDDDCRCPVHCVDEDADVCWCGDFPAVGCPIHLPAPGGAA